jgi:hypothetical protein
MEPFSVLKVKYQIKSNTESSDVSELETEIKIYDYSDLSIVMLCDESFGKSFSETFKTIGKYNGKLKIGKGWVFSKSKYGKLQQIISDIISFKIKGEIPVIYTKNIVEATDGPLGSIPVEPSIVKDFKKILNNLSETVDKMTYTSNGKTYVWGKVEDVNSFISETGALDNVVYGLQTKSHSIVVFNS